MGLMHCIGWIDFVFSFFDEEYNWNTTEKHNTQIHENIHIR